MATNRVVVVFFFFIGTLGSLASHANCDLTSYRKVFSACLPGRADSRLSLPANDSFGPYSGDYTGSWDLGPYSAKYAGNAFTPSDGLVYLPKFSILPPYNWGAVGQVCDSNFEPTAHGQCVEEVRKNLSDPRVNAQSSTGEFYWKAHGHNCHDAAEDVGYCVYNAESVLPSGCEMDVRVIVWDDEADIAHALGDVYHSQLLVKRWVANAKTGTQHEAVCLVESQVANPSGTFDEANCCTSNLALFNSGSEEDYHAAFGACDQVLTWGSNPHTYSVTTFRKERQTGEMDVSDGYDRQAGAKALRSNLQVIPNIAHHAPKVVSGVYSQTGTALMLNVK